jgi:hypothetical protein
MFTENELNSTSTNRSPAWDHMIDHLCGLINNPDMYVSSFLLSAPIVGLSYHTKDQRWSLTWPHQEPQPASPKFL